MCWKVATVFNFTPHACHQEIAVGFISKTASTPRMRAVKSQAFGSIGHRVMRRTIPVARKRKWQAAIHEEVAFWNEYISTRGNGRWEKELEFRLRPDTDLQAYVTMDLDIPPGGTLRLLDVGAGPISFLGKRWTDRTVLLTAVDPLAEYYNEILNRCGLKPPVATELAAGETLTSRFALNHFDVVHARNCIDHSLDAPQTVDQMLAITKVGGWVKLEHGICEATANNQCGLHSWNFLTDGGDFIIEAPGGERVNVTQRYAGLAEITCEVVPEKNWLSVRMKKLVPTLAAQSRPVVSVVVPCYNQAQYLPDAVDSVAAQTYRDFEIIIVDDGSPDDTAEVARQLAARHADCQITIINQPNGGLAAARNAGIRLARGKYILPLDCDDKISPDHLAKTVGFLEANPQVRIVGTFREDFGAATGVVQAVPYTLAEILQSNRNSYCSLYHREVWEAVGGYRTDMVPAGYEDWDFWIGCAEHGWLASILPEPLFHYRVKAASMFTEAVEHDAELRAQIILNHPRLFSAEQIDTARRCLAGMATSLDSASVQASELTILYAEAAKCMEQQAWVQGAQACQKILKFTPDDTNTLLCMARCFFETGDRQTTALISHHVLSLDPMNDIASENLKLLGESPRPQTTTDPKLLAARLGDEAKKLAGEGRWQEAMAICQQVLAVNPKDCDTRAILGRCYWEAGSTTTAELMFEEVLAADPQNALIRAWMGGGEAVAPATSDSTALVSVIVPTYYRPEWLPETLQSILAQTYRHFEIIVVNDAGPDISKIVEPLNAEGRIRVVTHEKNKGLAAARNTGIRAAQGKYIAYLDDDDIFHPNHLATLVNYLETSDDVVAYTDSQRAIQRKSGDQYVVVERDLPYSSDWDNDRVLVENFVPVLCFMHRKECIEKAGWFDETLTTHEDWDLWIRMSRHYRFHHIKQVTSEFRWRDDGSSMSSQRRADFLRTADVIYRKYQEAVGGRHDLAFRRQQFLLSLSRSAGPLAVKFLPESLLVSIVIPVFNRLDMTRPCIEAIHRETAAGTFEIIVVDNASSDGTAEFLATEEAAGRVRCIRNEQNLGFAKATNQGIRAARGGLILLLNNDTVPQPVWLEAMLDEMHVHPQVGAVGSCLLYPGGELIQHAGVVIGAGGGSIHPYHPWRLQRLDAVPEARESRDRQVVTAACVLTRRAVLDHVGLLDEGFINGFEDVDLCFRIGQAGYRLRYCATSRVIHHESMTPGRSAHEQANYQRLNERWKKIIKPDEIAELTALNGQEIQCRERLISEPDNAAALLTLSRLCQQRGDSKQAAEFQARARALKEGGKSYPISVSIIIPVLNNLELTKQCLNAIEHAGGLTMTEIIVVDNASHDGTPAFLREAQRKGELSFIRNEKNHGFAHACNQGAAMARGKFVLFLNNDTVVTVGWLDALWNTARKPDVGVVGAKLLYPDGTIQHAGIGWINGVPDHPGRHSNPMAPEVNTPRELDMVTGACLVMPRDLFVELGGFDQVYRNGVEDVDLCLRVRAMGRKVCYQPLAVVFHLEGKSAGRFDHVTDNLKVFFKRWQGWFDSNHTFKVPQGPRLIPAERSLFRPTVAGESPTVAWQGSFLDYGSLSHVNRALTDALSKQGGLRLTRVQSTKPEGDLPKALRRYRNEVTTTPAANPTVTVRHSWPPNWTAPQNGAWVQIQPWEFGALPVEWVQHSAQVDEFWVYTEYVRRVYVDSGVAPDKVKIVPLGIDPQKFHPAVAPLKLNTKKSFKFLFVGGTIRRKGPDLLLQAYLDTFTAADDVCLVIKDFGGHGVYAGQTFAEQIRAARAKPDAPEILYLNQDLAPEAVAGLYTACDCLVHPYRGEGFGLPVLEAMACGLPVVVTGGGATDDFATDEYAYRLPSRRESLGMSVGGFQLVSPGWLLEPDLKALAEQLRWVATHPAEATEKGQAASEYVRREWTWENSAKIAAQRLQRLLAPGKMTSEALAPAPNPVKRETPPVVFVGALNEARASLAKGELLGAWNATLGALQQRPFHPEAFLLLGEIASMSGDNTLARRCAERSRDLAPQWKAAKQFLKSLPGGNGKPSITLPPLPEPRKSPSLTVCMIVRNEEKFLRRSLESVRDIANQIVVVDTGSTDRTVEIAKEFGAEIHHFTWCDDFSAARNVALEHATGDWVLSLDADEELLLESKEVLRREINAASVIAYRLPIADAGRETDGVNYVPRLFRNAPGLHFVGRIHEQVFASVDALRKALGLENQLGKTKLLHHGYTAEVSKSRRKNERNLRLLEQSLAESPRDVNLLMNHGLELVKSGELKTGLASYFKALDTLGEDGSEAAPELRESLLTQLCTHLLSARDYDQIVTVLKSPLAIKGGLTASQHFLAGLALIELRQFGTAADHMRQCVAKRNEHSFTPVHAEIRGAGPQHCLAKCLVELKQTDAADAAFKAAILDDPQARAPRLDWAHHQWREGRPVEALNVLHQLVAEKPEDVSVWQLGGEISLSNPDFLEFAGDWTSEACRHVQNDAGVHVQRAEVLLLSQDLDGALPLWRRYHDPSNRRHQAALIVCELACRNSPKRVSATVEKAVSHEFFQWYRQLINCHAEKIIGQLNESIDSLQQVLPTAAEILKTAVSVAEQPAAPA